MPILAPNVTAPFDTVEQALQLARVRLNDAIASIGGEILTDTAVFSQTVVNAAWRRLQAKLDDLGFTMQTNEVVLTSLPPVTATSTDPTLQVWLNWSQYFDGANYFTPPNTPVLPQDFISPLRLWERQSGSNSVFIPMLLQLDGLPSVQKAIFNRMWEWRDNAIYMPGAIGNTDIRLRYKRYLPDFATQGSVQWYQQPMPIMRCVNAMADYIAFEMAKPRGDVNAADFLKSGDEEANILFNREIQLKERTNVRRRPYGKSRNQW